MDLNNVTKEVSTLLVGRIAQNFSSFTDGVELGYIRDKSAEVLTSHAFQGKFKNGTELSIIANNIAQSYEMSNEDGNLDLSEFTNSYLQEQNTASQMFNSLVGKITPVIYSPLSALKGDVLAVAKELEAEYLKKVDVTPSDDKTKNENVYDFGLLKNPSFVYEMVAVAKTLTNSFKNDAPVNADIPYILDKAKAMINWNDKITLKQDVTIKNACQDVLRSRLGLMDNYFTRINYIVKDQLPWQIKDTIEDLSNTLKQLDTNTSDEALAEEVGTENVAAYKERAEGLKSVFTLLLSVLYIYTKTKLPKDAILLRSDIADPHKAIVLEDGIEQYANKLSQAESISIDEAKTKALQDVINYRTWKNAVKSPVSGFGVSADTIFSVREKTNQWADDYRKTQTEADDKASRNFRTEALYEVLNDFKKSDKINVLNLNNKDFDYNDVNTWQYAKEASAADADILNCIIKYVVALYGSSGMTNLNNYLMESSSAQGSETDVSKAKANVITYAVTKTVLPYLKSVVS